MRLGRLHERPKTEYPEYTAYIGEFSVATRSKNKHSKDDRI